MGFVLPNVNEFQKEKRLKRIATRFVSICIISTYVFMYTCINCMLERKLRIHVSIHTM